ncbi:hypothetical protein SANA_04450 [Gottschalkiaceae bacterium SANA]|nr:hypothetical protein SANA_04450 [Gottschalkiaceae bacterium SANA]
MNKIQCEEINLKRLMNTNPLETLSIQYILKNKPKLICYTDSIDHPKGILIQSGYLHYTFAKDLAFIEDLLNHFSQPGEYGFAGIPREIATLIRARFEVEWSNPCTAYTLNKDDYHPERQIHKTKPLRL